MPDSPKPGMSERDIRAAGLAIDVPFESGEPQPQRLQYADLGEGHKYEATGEESDIGAGTHDGPLKGSEQAPSAVTPTGDEIAQDETGAQAASAAGDEVSDTSDTDVT